MMTKKKVMTLAAHLGCEIDINETEDGKQIELAAPEGKRWADGPGVMIARYAGTWGPAAEAWADLWGRMQYGLETDQ